jgi:hypothetical protein
MQHGLQSGSKYNDRARLKFIDPNGELKRADGWKTYLVAMGCDAREVKRMIGLLTKVRIASEGNRLCSALLGSARLCSARLGSARLTRPTPRRRPRRSRRRRGQPRRRPRRSRR